jgi:uncharacterized protein (TIGR02145 family)
MKRAGHLIIAVCVALTGILFGSCERHIQPKIFAPPKPCPGVAEVEYEGEVYPTILVGNQCWLAKNLNIGQRIDHLEESTDNGVLEKYCEDNLETNCGIYGGLYKWDEIMHYTDEEGTQGICPGGWRIPTTDDMMELYLYVEGVALYLLSDDPLYGFENSEYCDDCVGKTGFNIFNSSQLYQDQSDPFQKNSAAILWTSSQTHAIISNSGFQINPSNITGRMANLAYHVRCIKNED